MYIYISNLIALHHISLYSMTLHYITFITSHCVAFHDMYDITLCITSRHIRFTNAYMSELFCVCYYVKTLLIVCRQIHICICEWIYIYIYGGWSFLFMCKWPFCADKHKVKLLSLNVGESNVFLYFFSKLLEAARRCFVVGFCCFVVLRVLPNMQ